MEESDLLKERLQAITEKYRIQEDIRQKKKELDEEKLKLQHIKKKSLREQWLLQDSTSHNATDALKQQHLVSDQRQTRALQLNINRIELEVESLEREEYVISTNESFIINRLKAVEKSSEDIIKEVQESFVPEPIRLPTLIAAVPESPSPPASQHYEVNPPRKTLFAMEINVSKDLLTGESAVLSTAAVPPEELDQHTGLKVYDDGRKCVYALTSQEESHGGSCLSELSASEVEKLLKSATLHRQMNHQNYTQSQSRRDLHCFYNNQDKLDGEKRCDPRQQEGHFSQQLSREDMQERDFHCREDWWRNQEERRYGPHESHYRGQEERNNHGNLRDGHHIGNQIEPGHCYDNQNNHPYSSHQSRSIPNVWKDNPAGHHINGIIKSNSRVNPGRVNGHPPPRSHAKEEVSAYQSQLCYTPANHIPLSDYISVDEEQLYCFNQPSYQDVNAPSPLYGDDATYTILNTMDTTEPITAIFMGFQSAQDDSGQGQQFDGSLQAELIILDDIEDSEDNGIDRSAKKQRGCSQLGCHYPTECLANGNKGRGEGNKRMERPPGPGIKKIPKKHKPCCTVC